MKAKITYIVWSVLLLLGFGCTKFVTIESIPNRLLAPEVFNNSHTANNAIAGIYYSLKVPIFNSSGNLTVYTGLTSDELLPRVTNVGLEPYFNNSLQSATETWANYYKVIYLCNSAIEGLENNTVLHTAIRDQYLAEAKFVRSFVYFILVNLYGDVPLILSTDVRLSSQAFREDQKAVYTRIVSDLEDAKEELPTDYTFNNNERSRANRYVATALLARVYLYMNRYADAEAAATEVINTSLYELLPTPAGIFNKDNIEVLWQLEGEVGQAGGEAAYFLETNPTLVCTQSFLHDFDTHDARKSIWLRNVTIGGQEYLSPFKFTTIGTTSLERTTFLRLAEQYLIRAETRIRDGDIDGGIDDLNVIRQRASAETPDQLADLPYGLGQQEALLAVEKERRLELFAEYGHRWFDLKRTGRIDDVMGAEKPGIWQPYAAYFPIPLSDILRNGNLTQNNGYE